MLASGDEREREKKEKNGRKKKRKKVKIKNIILMILGKVLGNSLWCLFG
jgi:hypothetical protein